MANQLSDLVSVKKKDLPKAARTLAKAFFKDPMYIEVFPEESTRLDNLSEFFLFRTKYGFKYGEVYASSINFEGIAIWLPGNKAHVSILRGMFTGGTRFILKLGMSKMVILNEFNHFATNFRDSVIESPYLQLSPIGVNPADQGKGFGAKLILPMMKKLDEMNLRCFLETQVERNVTYYKKFGFEVVKEGKILGYNLQHWGMLREPKK